MEDGVVDAALSREELSVVDAVFVLDAPLPLDDRQHLDMKNKKRIGKAQVQNAFWSAMPRRAARSILLGQARFQFPVGMEPPWTESAM